jgi:GNAT superfamily N-acetyltransferase
MGTTSRRITRRRREPDGGPVRAAGCDVAWCREPSAAPALAAFFASSVTPSYISHSELMWGRAITPSRWTPGLQGFLQGEFGKIIRASLVRTPRKQVFTCFVADTLLALGIVTFAVDSPRPHAVLEDLIVGGRSRSRGLGALLIQWVERQAANRGARRLFLESGIGNHDAHRFFLHQGFRVTSQVMYKPIAPTRAVR